VAGGLSRSAYGSAPPPRRTGSARQVMAEETPPSLACGAIAETAGEAPAPIKACPWCATPFSPIDSPVFQPSVRQGMEAPEDRPSCSQSRNFSRGRPNFGPHVAASSRRLPSKTPASTAMPGRRLADVGIVLPLALDEAVAGLRAGWMCPDHCARWIERAARLLKGRSKQPTLARLNKI
jgi:hypothetical protein